MLYDIRPSHSHSRPLESLFDWQLDVERLEREAMAAVSSQQPNEWALVEAECSLDLIDAELTAARNSKADSDVATATVRHLEQWRARVEGAIKRLRSLEG